MPTTVIPAGAPTMPHPDVINAAIREAVEERLRAQTVRQPGHRCPKCSAVYPNGSLLCERDGKDLLPSPELQAIVRQACNDIGIFVVSYGTVLLDPLRIIDGWQFDPRPWLKRVHGIDVGAGGVLQQTTSVNAPAPGSN
jgi:hypothetical protein